jgi:hypothetical protein
VNASLEQSKHVSLYVNASVSIQPFQIGVNPYFKGEKLGLIDKGGCSCIVSQRFYFHLYCINLKILKLTCALYKLITFSFS